MIKTNKALIPWTAIGVIAAIIALLLSTAQYRYDIKGVDAATTMTCSYSASQSSVCSIKQGKHWLKGKLIYGFVQTSGAPKSTKYDFSYKKDSGKWIMLKNYGYAVSNGRYQGEYYGHYSDGKSIYTYKLQRVQNPSKQNSKMNVDLMIQ